jgi:hypothetical protein
MLKQKIQICTISIQTYEKNCKENKTRQVTSLFYFGIFSRACWRILFLCTTIVDEIQHYQESIKSTYSYATLSFLQREYLQYDTIREQRGTDLNIVYASL